MFDLKTLNCSEWSVDEHPVQFLKCQFYNHFDNSNVNFVKRDFDDLCF